MSTEANKDLVRRYLAGSWDWERLRRINEVLSRDFAYHGPLGRELDRQGYIDALYIEMEAVSDFFVRIDDLLAEDDRVAVRFCSWFIHHGEFMETDITGRTINVCGESFFRIREGKVCELWEEYDRFAMLKQMGGRQRLTEKDESQIRQLVSEINAVAFLDDEMQASRLYADEAELMPSHGPIVRGRKSILRWMQALAPLSEWKVQDLKVDGVGNFACVSGAYSVLVSPEGEAPYRDTGKYVQIWRKQKDGSWKIAKDIFNSDLPIPAGGPTRRAGDRVQLVETV
jgi:predicted ester cyclase/ketosteroid isomerase-like protein